eukprot:g78977.t1
MGNATSICDFGGGRNSKQRSYSDIPHSQEDSTWDLNAFCSACHSLSTASTDDDDIESLSSASPYPDDFGDTSLDNFGAREYKQSAEMDTAAN